MWRLILKTAPLLLLIAVLMLGPSGCKRKKKRASENDEPAGMATMLQAADPRSAVQLIRGFHGVEAGAWRWTEQTFAVSLKPPAGAAANGATLVLKFVLPDVVVQKLGPVTLSAKIGSSVLTPEKFSVAGEQTYSRPVPAEALKSDAVTVEFALDKALPPTGEDIRQLGVILNMVGFEAKQP
jgi:hypothetical protein